MQPLQAPTYELIVPSTGQKVQCRPYFVSEEKILAIAAEADDHKSIVNAVKRIIHVCSDGAIDPNTLSLYDLEYLFIHIRSKSVGELSRIKIKCSEESCDTYNDVELDLSKTQLIRPDSISNVLVLSDEVTIELSHITTGAYERFDVGTGYDISGMETLTKLIACSIRKVNGVDSAEYEVTDMLSFIESFSRDTIHSIQKFLESTPAVQTTIEFKCRKCKKDNRIVVTGLPMFFKIAMAHMSLLNYYKENFAMMQHHGYSLTELEAMIPWEREIYLALLGEHIVAENERINKQNSEMKAKSRGR